MKHKIIRYARQALAQHKRVLRINGAQAMVFKHSRHGRRNGATACIHRVCEMVNRATIDSKAPNSFAAYKIKISNN